MSIVNAYENVDVLSQWWFYLIIAVVALAVAGGIGALYYFFVAKKKKIEKTQQIVEKKIDNATSEVAESFGGKENILSISHVGSRVTVNVKSSENISTSKLDSLGLKGAIVMGNKVVFPLGANAQQFYLDLKKKIGID